ncbi:SGNH/GDSL hydrolase family protein [Chitinophaga sp. SYP-B3965]|uniref:SGNH/GDSL hydrolase family protein n=1 Tax=Chitinophaga sp. SYP-B3965 TaxID=2663120 RepID=UPI001564EAF3|nr:SGNH/GDSL hydrolase family protein [Chitinophaga sp. SYP-B3965]
MKKTYLLLVLSLCAISATYAQDSARYTDATSFMLIGKGLPTNKPYVRLDTVQTEKFPQAVKYLSTNSAGVAVLFETNSKFIKVKWSVSHTPYHSNMTPIVHSGLDLYGKKDGKWVWAGVGRPVNKLDAESVIVNNMDSSLKQFMLYAPTYNALTALEIGVAPEATIRIPSKPGIDTTTRIVMYGSSIMQGASASRPGMAYPAIIARHTGWDVVNLGFSGAGKMEFAVAEVLATMKASIFVLDCMPNPTLDEIKERGYPFIKHLLTKRPEVPVLLVESAIYESGNFDQRIADVVRKKNALLTEIYTKLKQEGFKQLHYLSAKGLIGEDHEGATDGVHLNDIGFQRQAKKVQSAVQSLVKKSGGSK